MCATNIYYGQRGKEEYIYLLGKYGYKLWNKVGILCLRIPSGPKQLYRPKQPNRDLQYSRLAGAGDGLTETTQRKSQRDRDSRCLGLSICQSTHPLGTSQEWKTIMEWEDNLEENVRTNESQ